MNTLIRIAQSKPVTVLHGVLTGMALIAGMAIPVLLGQHRIRFDGLTIAVLAAAFLTAASAYCRWERAS